MFRLLAVQRLLWGLYCSAGKLGDMVRGPQGPGRVQLCGSFSVYADVKSKMWWRMFHDIFFSFFELVPFLALFRVIFSGTDW